MLINIDQWSSADTRHLSILFHAKEFEPLKEKLGMYTPLVDHFYKNFPGRRSMYKGRQKSAS